MSHLLWPPPKALSVTKNHFHFYAWKTLFDKFQKYVILTPTPTHLTPLESCQKVFLGINIDLGMGGKKLEASVTFVIIFILLKASLY